jgi:hypothetical protein
VGFLLSVFEAEFIDEKGKRDLFDLKKMRKILIKESELEELNLTKSLEATTIC